jgi:hypothetical protein
MERQVAFLEDRTHANRELAPASSALIEAVALDAVRVLLGRFRADTRQLVVLIDGTAMRANRAFRPKDFLYMLESGGFIMEVGAGQNGHRLNSLSLMYNPPLGLSSV